MASLDIRMFVASGDVAPHPVAEVTVPAGFKIIGGGALIPAMEPGNYLTASFPVSQISWAAFGKDHEAPSPASVTVFAFAINDPGDEWEVHYEFQQSAAAHHPRAVATLPEGFVLTGGGAFVHASGGAGNILTASFPNTDRSWEARSEDFDISDPCQISAHAIGVRPRSGRVRNQIRSLIGPVVPHPSTRVVLDPGFTLSGGGAFDQFTGAGNLLTASCPDVPGVPVFSPRAWNARGKDHFHPSPAAMQAFAIGVQTF
jgi:vibriolysin